MHVRRGAPLSLALLLLASAPLPAQAPTEPSLTVRGFVSATGFMQDAFFAPGNGQQSLLVSQELDEWWHGADVRSTRLALDFVAPGTFGNNWRAGGTIEMDFFGPFAAGGAFGDEQALPRLRLAYLDITNGRTRIRAGQDWSLTLGLIPQSMSHLGFVMGWASGSLGWRFPQVSVRHPLSRPGAAITTTLQVAVLRNSWVDEPVADLASAGEAGTPQLEARVDFEGQRMAGGSWMAYVVGHWDRKDLNGVVDGGENLTSWAVEGGARFNAGRLTLQGNAYTGQAMGHHFGNIIQFGEIEGWGGWVQGGLALNPRWSVWLYAGADNADEEDVRAAGGADRISNLRLVPMLRYASGPYSFGVEWLRDNTEYTLPVDTEERQGNALLVSVKYDFAMRFTPR